MEGSKACRLDLKCRSLWHCRRESEQSGWELRRGKEMEEEVGRGIKTEREWREEGRDERDIGV